MLRVEIDPSMPLPSFLQCFLKLETAQGLHPIIQGFRNKVWVRKYTQVWEREPTQVRAREPEEVCRGELTSMCMIESSKAWIEGPFRSGHRAQRAKPVWGTEPSQV